MSELQTSTVDSTRPARVQGADIALPLVLVADPDGSSRTRRADQLLARGFRIVQARTSFEAIVKAACLLPDLIVMAASLGDGGCAETAELIGTCPSTAHIPIVRLSAGRRVPLKVFALARC